jgi:hypothetical protein
LTTANGESVIRLTIEVPPPPNAGKIITTFHPDHARNPADILNIIRGVKK